MQKKIIALAIAAAFSAPAFADTTVYGIVDAAVVNISANGVKGGTAVSASGLAGSRLGVKSSEDLGNGMKASVVLEYSLDNTDSAGIGNARQEMLALSGGFGTVAAGYLQTTGFDFSGKFDPTAGSLITPLGALTSGGGFLIGNAAALKRAPKALAYISPDFSGLSFALNYSADTMVAGGPAGGLGDVNTPEADATTKGSAYLASVDYKAGALAAGFVYASNTAPITIAGVGGAKTTEWALGASFDLDMAKLFATYQVESFDGVSDTDKVFSLSATMPVTSAGTAVVTYANAKFDAMGTDISASGFTAAWLQAMSKTTTAYAAISTMGNGSVNSTFSVANNAVTNITAGESSRMIAVGLNKKF